MSITNEKTVQGKTYYISEAGDDRNDGMTANSAWRTFRNITEEFGRLSCGDVVLFETDGIYRGAFHLVSGVTYSSYGDGTRPKLYGSLKNYADDNLWTHTENKNIWQINVGEMSDIGNIVFDNGETFGMKRLDLNLSEKYDFYHDREKGILFLNIGLENPGSQYRDIEICSNEHIMRGSKQYMHDIVIENLCVGYTGGHGISFSHGSNNITVRNCEICYIGGSMMDDTVRYGNGFEVVDGCSNILVENNWVYQCYDAGITHQSSYQPGCVQEKIVFRGNLIEKCNYNIEYYVSQSNGIIIDTLYENNVLRNAGRGFGSVNRIGSDVSECAHICCYTRNIPCKNFIIKNNVFDKALCYLTTIGCTNSKDDLGPVVSDNYYIQEVDENNSIEIAKIWDFNEKKKVPIKVKSQFEMESVIKTIDKNPRAVILKTKNVIQ